MTGKYRSRLAWMLLFTLFLSLLCGCRKNNIEEKSPQTESLPMILTSDCTLVYPNEVSPTFFANIQKLQSDIEQKCGFSPALSNDFIPLHQDKSADMEILIGNTVREESRAVMEEIGFYDYAIRKVGSKIVIAAHTEGMLYEAMSVFASDMLTTGGMGVTVGEDILFTSEQKGFFESFRSLSEYRVVYPASQPDYREIAEGLAKSLKRKYGVELAVLTDAEAPSGYEILLGSTNRAVFADYYRGEKMPDALHFSICARDGSLMLLGGGERATRIAAERLILDFAKVEWSYRFDLPYGWEKEYVAYDYNDPHTEREAEADIRIMSYNILSKELSPDKADFSERAEMVLSTVLAFMPDVVGLQEVSEKAYGIIEQTVGQTYAITEKMTPNGEYSYTSMMYNKNTVRYIEGGNHIYSVGNKRIRIISWGLFEKKESGQRFVAVSTHWDIVLDHRPQQAAQMTEFVNHLKATYECPIFTTGDFNTLDSVGYYKNYVSETGQTDARYDAAQSGIVPTGDVIDHITATSADTVTLFYQYIETALSVVASDHNPVIADYKFE